MNLCNYLADLERLDYSDGTPSVLFTNYDRAGLPRLIVDASGHHELRFDHAGRLLADLCTNGLLAGVTVTNHFDPQFGRDQLRVEGVTPVIQHEFHYDTLARLTNVAGSGCSAEYAYAPFTDRLGTTTFKAGGQTRLQTTRQWEFGERLQSIANLVNGTPVSSRHYLYDAVHRRTQAGLEICCRRVRRGTPFTNKCPFRFIRGRRDALSHRIDAEVGCLLE